VLEELLWGPRASPQQRYTRLEAQLERKASRPLLEYRSRLQGRVLLRLPLQQATEPARPASELEVEAWMQSLWSRQPVSVRPVWQASHPVAAAVLPVLELRVWVWAPPPEAVLAPRSFRSPLLNPA
jgi:hypothetical protein